MPNHPPRRVSIALLLPPHVLLHPSVPLDQPIKSKAGAFRSQTDDLDSNVRGRRQTLRKPSSLSKSVPFPLVDTIEHTPAVSTMFTLPDHVQGASMPSAESENTLYHSQDWNMSMPLTPSSQQTEVTFDYARQSC
ncbi:hypothetical protein BLNAU_15175 [Blattamonas nauphoetae]|uniref:Uncharacterized protein n=1 Tax=Blattamonas nauphoetae TaxID=2049346 RepID=A0ABQ9XGW0_9EUKA|nr:hypothetical protein BLNAU_15175 [Blattamonas nauphoetae]